MKKRIISMVVSAAVLVTMCFGTTAAVFAGEKTGVAVTQTEIEGVGEASFDVAPIPLIADDEPLTLNDDVVVPGQDDKKLTGANFKISAPATGYIFLSLVGRNEDSDYNWSIYAKTNGYTDFEYFYSYNNFTRVFAVKKGVYTVNVKNNYCDYYLAAAKFVSVKESKYGTKKSKAKKIAKKKVQKGLMITGAQKTHWYKFKNTKKHKVKITFNTILEDTGKYGGIKVTVYKGKKSFGTRTIGTNETNVIKP